jgi:hypothetical protein
MWLDKTNGERGTLCVKIKAPCVEILVHTKEFDKVTPCLHCYNISGDVVARIFRVTQRNGLIFRLVPQLISRV